MENLNLIHRTIGTGIVIAIIFSSFTLWLGDSWTKYLFFILEIFVIVTIYIILNDFELPFNLKNLDGIRRIFSSSFSDALLVSLSALLFTLNLLHFVRGTDGGVTQLVLAFVCASFLPGYALLNIFKVTRYFSKIEILILSSVFSFAISGFCTLVLISSNENTRALVIPLIFISIGLVSILRRKWNKTIVSTSTSNSFAPKSSLSMNIDIFAIALSVIFYIIFFFMLYPNGALVADTDATRHYDYSIVLSRTPELYTSFSYLLFHAFSATLHVLAGPNQPVASFQTIQVILNLLFPLSVYVIAKRFVASLDRRIPAIATIFFTFLTNFSFISFTFLKLSNNVATQFQSLQTISQTSFKGIEEIAQPFSYFRPQAEAFVMFIMAFMLLKNWDIPRREYILILASLILAMYLTHVAEAIAFVIFISLYSFVGKHGVLRLDVALQSSLIAFVSAGVIVCFELFVWPTQLRIVNFNNIIQAGLEIILPILLVSISILWRNKRLWINANVRISFKVKFNQIFRNKRMPMFVSKHYYPILSVFLVIVYLLGLLKWFNEDFVDDSLVYYTGYLPWFAYPLLLGIVGLLAVLSIRYFGYSLAPSARQVIIAILIFILTMILVGRLVSVVNLNFGFIGFYENRFIIYIFLFTSLLAPIPLIKLIDQVRLSKTRLPVTASVFAIISVIILSGFSSMVLYSDYWNIIANKSNNPYTPSENEWNAINYLKKVLQHDTHAFTIAPSKQTNDELSFATSPNQFFWSPILLDSKYPAIPLLSLAAYNLDHAYLFLHTRDLEILENFTNGWFVGHLLPMLPVIFSNQDVTIYNVTRVSYPLPHSETTMILPAYPTDDSWLYSYDVISQAERGNYTVKYDVDHSAFDSKTVILSTDLKDADRNLLYKCIAYVRSGGHLVVLDPNGHGILYNDILKMPNSLIQERKLIQTYDYKNNKSSIFSVPVSEITLGLGRITYIDIYPLLSHLHDNNISKAALYSALGKVSSLLNMSKTTHFPTNFQNIPSFPVFKVLTGKGNINMNSQSIIFPRNQILSHLRVWHGLNQNSISIGNVTAFGIDKYKTVDVRGNHNNISLANGTGLYGKFTFNNEDNSSLLNVYFDKKATITGLSNGTRSFIIENVSAINITSNHPVIIYAREPKIHFTGELVRHTGIPQSMLNFADSKYSGMMYLSIFMSDSYTLFDHISLDGKSQRIPSYSKYNEIASLPMNFVTSKLYSSPHLVRALLVVPFLIAFIFLVFIPGNKGIKLAKKS